MKWALVFVAACTDASVVMMPVIDLPTNDSASAFPLDQLDVEVAHDGDTLDLSSAKFSKGQTVSVGGVPFADDIVVHLTGFVGTSEVAYGRSCAVAVTADGPNPEPHLYFSRSVKFGQLPAMTGLRVDGVAVTYHDGSGLLVGGKDPTTSAPVSSIERFDPRTGELEQLATMTDPRIGAVATPLGVGTDAQIAVIGGTDSAGQGAQFVDLIEADEPEARRVEMVSDSHMSRVGLTATTLFDGRVIVIGGHELANAAVGDVDEVTTENGTAVVRVLRATLANPRYDHTATLLSNDVGAPILVAGGRFDAVTPPIAAAELYKPLAEGFSTASYTMQTPRVQHKAVVMPDGSVLIIGGIGASGPVSQLELFTLDGGFTALNQPLPATAGLVDFTATTLPDGRVLLTGGLDFNGNPTAAAFIARLDPLNGQVDVIATDALAQPRAGHQATLLCDGTVLISGGTADPVPPERYNPPPDGRR